MHVVSCSGFWLRVLMSSMQSQQTIPQELLNRHTALNPSISSARLSAIAEVGAVSSKTIASFTLQQALLVDHLRQDRSLGAHQFPHSFAGASLADWLLKARWVRLWTVPSEKSVNLMS